MEKSIYVYGQLPGEEPVLLAIVHSTTEYKSVKDEYMDVFPEVKITYKFTPQTV